MNHLFIPSKIDGTKCTRCNRPLVDHGPNASCESCSNKGKCEINGEGILLCETCYGRESDALIAKVKESASKHNELVKEEVKFDLGLVHPHDLYNINLAPIETLWDRTADYKGEERQFQFHKLLTDRYLHLKGVLFERDKVIDDLNKKQITTRTEINVISKTLRDKEKELRDEIRARLKEADDKYVPATPKKVEPRVKGEKKSAIDMMVEALAHQKGISKEEAKKFIEAFQSGAFEKDNESAK